jgi:putative Ca2+/H+ antiporter (TMEM165/GDT1 family)
MGDKSQVLTGIAMGTRGGVVRFCYVGIAMKMVMSEIMNAVYQ